MVKWMLPIVGVVALMGCSEEEKEATVPVSSAKCEITTNPDAPQDGYTFCHHFANWPTTSLTQAKSDCESSDELGGAGTWSEDAQTSNVLCSEIGKLGDCSWTATNTIVTTYNGVPDGESAEDHCGEAWSGTWTAE